MTISKLIKLIKKKGFLDTLEVIMQFKDEDYKTDKHSFYDGLNKFSYYNSFFRVKADLHEKVLIRIEKDEYNRTYIQLTNKGLQVYDKLIEIAILFTDSIINEE